jgi:hypothetical protein
MSIITAASLSALGYRRLSDLPKSGGGLDSKAVASLLCEKGDYTAISNDWVRRRGRAKNTAFVEPMKIVSTIDRTTVIDENTFEFVKDYFCIGYPTAKEQLGVAEFSSLTELARDAEDHPDRRWYGMSNLGKALLFAGKAQLIPLLRDHVIPWFLKTYPQGKIVSVSYSYEYFRMPRKLKATYTAAQTPITDFKKYGIATFPTLEMWQTASVVEFGKLLLDFFGYLFYPYISAYQTGPFGLTFLFLFDPAEKYEPPIFPQDWMAIPRSHAGFGEEDFDRSETLKDMKGQVAMRAAHQRYLHSHCFSADERLLLLEWLLGKINRLFYELTDVASFTEDFDPDRPIDPVFALEHYLTVERLIRKTLGVMSINEISSSKGATFEVADLYDTMSLLLKKMPSTEFYKLLFNTSDGSNFVRAELSPLPEPFRSYFQDLSTKLYGEIEKAILDSVWFKPKVTTAGVAVRNKDLTGENVEPPPRFVANVMRAFRNAHHGYFTLRDAGKNRPSRYLFPITGNVPDSITTLPVLWLLAYLANPRITGWNHLEVNHYD